MMFSQLRLRAASGLSPTGQAEPVVSGQVTAVAPNKVAQVAIQPQRDAGASRKRGDSKRKIYGLLG